MRPEKLIISGWGPYKTKTEIDFTKFDGRGLFLVTGATGAGKTTIFDAITYALYGSLSGEMREKNSVRSDFADADTPTFVELFMCHDGKEYHIVRNPEYTRPKKRVKSGALTKEKENAVLHLPDGRILEGTKEVNAKVQEILVLDYQQFKQITMIAQGEFARLLTAPPKDKTRIFRDIFGTGIYEQFAQALRAKSNELYGKVMEQRHKLEEDVRMLLVNRQEQEMTRKLVELTETDNWNYDALQEELDAVLKAAEEREQYLQAECDRMQQETSELTGLVTTKKIENEQIERLQQAKIMLLKLQQQEDSMREKRVVCEQAKLAETLLPYKIKMQTDEDALMRAKSSLERLQENEVQASARLEKLSPFIDQREIWQKYLDACKAFTENQEKEAAVRKSVEKSTAEWAVAKENYLTAEKHCDKKREAYAEAERAYRHAMVGIVAEMLQENKPCPVCGSLEHPHPATKEPGVLTEAELNALKAEVQKAEKILLGEQEKAATLKVLLTEQEKNLQKLQGEMSVCEKEMAESKEQILRETSFAEDNFWQFNYREKAGYVQEKTELVTKLRATISAAKEHKKETEVEIANRNSAHEDSKRVYLASVKEAGFTDVTAAEAALLEKKEIERLSRELEAYTKELTSVKGVAEHLEETLTNKETHNLQPLYDKAEQLSLNHAEKQKALKQAHAFYEEVKKTTAQFAEKLTHIAKAREEYGYVKDLDNLASGNNAKRLVFEQYVLAGYFEEILRAANLRFRKMTGCRYEMSRVQEAGDGRVKDSLEIQVMDYYTGKSRSVKTLSGGESFKASLSLALGMSDVIQAMNGGIKVDTLFIDEGFGALDSESLDQACETLMGLVEHNRLIGIISHVPELRERIDCQLVVEKTNSGSSVKIRV